MIQNAYIKAINNRKLEHMTPLNTLISKHGTKLITTTGTLVKEKFSGFVPAEDTVISELLDKNGVNIIEQITDNPLESFMQLVNSAPESANFYGIKLSSGKVTLILEPITDEDFKR